MGMEGAEKRKDVNQWLIHEVDSEGFNDSHYPHTCTDTSYLTACS